MASALPPFCTDLALAVKTDDQFFLLFGYWEAKVCKFMGPVRSHAPPQDMQSQVPLQGATFGAAQLSQAASSWKLQAAFISFIIYAQHVGTGPLVIKAPRDRNAC